jgi:L-methionine (R)-S-oxide reductase
VSIVTDCTQVVAIIDIDCAELSGFGEEDRIALEKLAFMLNKSCDFPLLSDLTAGTSRAT